MTIGFEDFQSFVTVLVAISAILATVWGGVNVIKEAMKPLRVLDERVDDVEEKLDRDNRRIQDLEESNRLVLKAIDNLIGHELSGTHQEELRKVQAEIHQYLINR